MMTDFTAVTAMGTAVEHPVPDWVKLSFVIFTSGHFDTQG